MPTADENARKALQRAKQQAALKRQAEGGVTKRELKRRRAAGEPLPKLPKKPKERVHQREQWKAADAKAEESRPGNHDVVIIPIFWRNVEGQEDAMVKESQRIKSMLHKAGLDVWVDRTHKRTPGQKLNFWESEGVRWRVEIGPKEAAKMRCVVSHQRGDPGDYSTVTKLANVSTVKRAQLLGKLRNGLNLLKISEAAVTEAANDPEGDAKQAEMSGENLKCMLEPKSGEDGKRKAAAPWTAPEKQAPPTDWAQATTSWSAPAASSWKPSSAPTAKAAWAKGSEAEEAGTGAGKKSKKRSAEASAGKEPNAKERRAMRRAQQQAAGGKAAE